MKKTILVSADRGETRVAVLESKTKGGKPNVAELYIERRGRRSIVGNIYKGKVDNVLPGMEAAFVDIGLERNGFLHVDEIVLPNGEQVADAAVAAAAAGSARCSNPARRSSSRSSRTR